MTIRKKTTAAARKKKPALRGARETINGAAIAWDRTGNRKGRGVFARRAFKKGEIIEIAPVIPIARKNIRHNGDAPDGYLLMWREDVEGQEYCMPLGYIMLYNHSAEPNIGLTSDFRSLSMTAEALRPIAAGEELVWDYQCEIWFDEA